MTTHITIHNLTKTYKDKKGVEVHALKGISLAMPEKGMVFILGKSGCGKSTLLNMLGGLDGFDDGDIVINGKSMKSFTAGDMDEYRRNFVGFVFQENNLLEDYTVKRNIALALDLQGEKNYEERVNEVISSVGLTELSERKCNRISGGQKQRTAIARALIKNPEMLLCDEPTGALDSDTGEEIFNLLKDVSKERLVIVVSHDRESAEKYGDRVIEIKDGKVEKDSVPEITAEAPEEKQAKNRKGGGLSAKNSFGIGLRYLVAKPIRLALCVFICLITFFCIGIADTVGAYDRDNALLKTMNLYETPYISYKKICEEIGIDKNTNITGMYRNFTDKDVETVKQAKNLDRLDKVYDLFYGDSDGRYYTMFLRDNEIRRGSTNYGVVELDDTFVSDYGFKLYGRYPETYNEAVITYTVYKNYEFLGYKEILADGKVSTDKIAINTIEDMIGKEVAFRNVIYGENNQASIEYTRFKIVGVLDTLYDTSTYGKLAVDPSGEYSDYGSYRHERGIDSCLYLKSGYFENNCTPSNDGDVIALATPFNGSNKVKLNKIKDYNIGTETVEIAWNKFENYHIQRTSLCSVFNGESRLIDEVDDTMNMLKPVFFWASIGMTVIAALFLLYYTSGVVTDKKREIGVLRAMGASRADVLKLFGVENGVFAAILIAVATALSAIGAFILNGFLTESFGIKAVIVSFAFRQFAVLFAVAVLAVVAGVAIPVIKLLKSKPVDIIADRK